MNQRYQCHIDVLIQQYHILPMKHTVHRFMFICIHTYIKCTSNYNPNSHRATTDILVINTILSQNMNTAACWFTDPNKQAGEREEFRFYLMLIIVEDSELSKSLQITGNAAGPFHNQLLPIKTRGRVDRYSSLEKNYGITLGATQVPNQCVLPAVESKRMGQLFQV